METVCADTLTSMVQQSQHDKTLGERLPVSVRRRAQTVATARELRQTSTSSEDALWEALRGRRLAGYRFRRQQPMGPFIVDFYCSSARAIVEVDGPVHDNQHEYDSGRQAELEAAGYRVLRVSDEQVIRNLPSVLKTIFEFLSAPSLPLSRAQGEGAARIRASWHRPPPLPRTGRGGWGVRVLRRRRLEREGPPSSRGGGVDVCTW